MSFWGAIIDLWVRTEDSWVSRAWKTIRGGCTGQARTVTKEVCAFLHRTWGWRTDRAAVESSAAQIIARAMFVPWRRTGLRTGHVQEACALIFGVARGVPSSTRAVFIGCMGLDLGCTGRVRAASSVLHGACNSARVKLIFCTGRAISFFWGRKS